MKNQYVADVGDYGKYSLLRYLAQNSIRIGINWYLTKSDDTNDGKHISYLNKQAYRKYDPVVFDGMKELIDKKKRDVKEVEKLGLIPGATYYGKELSTTPHPWDQRIKIRDQWHRNALKSLESAELIFADPDNGTIGAKSAASKDAEKYTLPKELLDYYDKGKDFVYYCQKARRSEAAWEKKKMEMTVLLPDAAVFVLTFHRGSCRSYIFLVHPERKKKYGDILTRFVEEKWNDGSQNPPFEIEI